MITAKLNGGLGNQMFQIATAWGLAFDNKDKCAFRFNNPIVHQGNMAFIYKKNVFSQIEELQPNWKPQHIFKERRDNVYESIPYQTDLQIEGYFQCEKYFVNHRDSIIDLFRHKPTIERLKYDFNEILTESVSVHIRRGDYLTFNVCIAMDYYYQALALLNDRDITNILVFSDDIEWCKQNFMPDSYKTRYIHSVADYEDLYLMSLCTNNIVGNSTFSWWASYLNRNPDKIVYMPKPFGAHTDGIYYKDVITVDR